MYRYDFLGVSRPPSSGLTRNGGIAPHWLRSTLRDGGRAARLEPNTLLMASTRWWLELRRRHGGSSVRKICFRSAAGIMAGASSRIRPRRSLRPLELPCRSLLWSGGTSRCCFVAACPAYVLFCLFFFFLDLIPPRSLSRAFVLVRGSFSLAQPHEAQFAPLALFRVPFIRSLAGTPRAQGRELAGSYPVGWRFVPRVDATEMLFRSVPWVGSPWFRL